MKQLAACDWQTIGRVLSAEDQPDVLVVARSQLLSRAAPRCLKDLQTLMHAGIGVCIRHAERHDEALASLAGALESELPGRVHVQLFATPGGTHGFGWHFDAEEVFIVQTAGSKDYYFRENTVSPRAPKANPDFARVRQESSVLQTARLIAGDCLYVPRYWWHMARSIHDSLSISLGLT